MDTEDFQHSGTGFSRHAAFLLRVAEMRKGKIVALIGEDPVIDEVLNQLLSGADYRLKILTESTASAEGVLDGVHLLILAPGLKMESRNDGFTGFASILEVSEIPILELISDLTPARNLRGQPVLWPCRVEELKRHIDNVLLTD